MTLVCRIFEEFYQCVSIRRCVMAGFRAVDNPRYRQIDLPAVLIEQTDTFRLAIGDKTTDELAVVEILDELA